MTMAWGMIMRLGREGDVGTKRDYLCQELHRNPTEHRPATGGGQSAYSTIVELKLIRSPPMAFQGDGAPWSCHNCSPGTALNRLQLQPVSQRKVGETLPSPE
ncbi:hypothetical protein NHX12_011648 [Muraenolepis orangiensis]|uniref:Uncharacterized protein n=1 Tax=Muraenolepis orangiensis TaxID=630683 RepID=A0A9Q0I6X3_9TELE|nr:hypothetical protein NHX12_011648 [Muraenolepis orangiensis]